MTNRTTKELLKDADLFVRAMKSYPGDLSTVKLIAELSDKVREREEQLVRLYEGSVGCYECGDGVYIEFSDIIDQMPTPPKKEDE